MSVSRVKVWIAGDILTAADLNVEFDAAMGTQFDNPMTTAGDTIYGGTDGAATRLAKGTATQLLAMNSGATAPEWITGSGTYVTKALYDAYSILMATTDNTPVVLTVGEQTIPGRLVGGAIKALSNDEIVKIANWAYVPVANYTTAPASTSTITMAVDMTASILVRMGLRYTIGGTEYFGSVGACAAALLTVNGAPLSGNITNLQYGGTVSQITYDNSSSTSVLTTGTVFTLRWDKPKSYLVLSRYYQVNADGSADGKVTVKINATETNTSAGGLTIAADTTWYSTVVDLAVAAYDVNPGEDVIIVVTQGTGVDGYGLKTNMVFVTP